MSRHSGALGHMASYVSCGVHQLHGVHYITEDGFRAMINGEVTTTGDYGNIMSGYVYVFSDNSYGAGKSMAKWIKDYDCGELVELPWSDNPNSGLSINAWLWRYNGKKIPLTAPKVAA